MTLDSRRQLLIMSNELDKAFDIVESVSEVTPEPEVKKPPKKVETIDQVQDDYELSLIHI